MEHDYHMEHERVQALSLRAEACVLLDTAALLTWSLEVDTDCMDQVT